MFYILVFICQGQWRLLRFYPIYWIPFECYFLQNWNEYTDAMVWPLPDQDELLHKIAQSLNMSKVDHISGFDQTTIYLDITRNFAAIINHLGGNAAKDHSMGFLQGVEPNLSHSSYPCNETIYTLAQVQLWRIETLSLLHYYHKNPLQFQLEYLATSLSFHRAESILTKQRSLLVRTYNDLFQNYSK